MITINTSSPTLYITTLLTSSLMSSYILVSNYVSGTYTATQDTIAIPLIATTVILAILILFSLIQNPLYKQLKHQKPANTIATTSALFATTLSSALLIGSIHYWFAPNHLTISTLYFLTLSTYLMHQFKLFKKLVTRSKQPTQTGHP